MAWRISRDKQFNSAKKNNQIMHSLTFKIVYVPIWKFNPYKQKLQVHCWKVFGIFDYLSLRSKKSIKYLESAQMEIRKIKFTDRNIFDVTKISFSKSQNVSHYQIHTCILLISTFYASALGKWGSLFTKMHPLVVATSHSSSISEPM